MRVKLATRGSGRWQASGGYRSKFGLTVAEMLNQLDRLIDHGMGDCFQLLHFHVGSQVGNIRRLKAALVEAARIYVDLHRRGAGLKYLDVGGGLGVDYDGSQSDTASSMNYTVQDMSANALHSRCASASSAVSRLSTCLVRRGAIQQAAPSAMLPFSSQILYAFMSLR